MRNPSNIRCNGDKVRQLRKNEAMTQEKLALMSNVSHRTVQRAESNKPIQLDTIASLAAALKVTVSDLVVNSESISETSDFSSIEKINKNRHSTF